MEDVHEIYDEIGDDGPFYELVERFYDGVEVRPALRALYPGDLEPGKKHLAWFLIQRFGGPSHFNANRGAPMLRRRHMAFAIDITARDEWVDAMMAAVSQLPILSRYSDLIQQYFDDAATFLINRSEPPEVVQVLNQA